MLTEMNLQELLDYQTKHPVLSVYLNTDPLQGNADSYKLQLRTMLKDIDMPEDTEAVDNYFSREFDWVGRSVVVFSCAADDFFRAYPLAIPLRSRVRISDHPHVKPLADLLDYYGGYGVVLVDKQGARLFSFHLGELEEQEGIMGEDVRHVKRGGASSFPGRRGGIAGRTQHGEEVADRNMRDTAQFAAHFFNEHHVRRVLIGGTDENSALLRSLLPKTWQSLIVGAFPMAMTATKEDVLARAMNVGKQAEMRQEEDLLNKVVTGAAKGKAAALNLDATLGAVHDGRVQTLVVKEGYRAAGYKCKGCGYVTARQLTNCPFCGAAFEQIADAVEMAVHSVMRAGGEVEVLQHSHKVKGFDNIGALLRY